MSTDESTRGRRGRPAGGGQRGRRADRRTRRRASRARGDGPRESGAGRRYHRHLGRRGVDTLQPAHGGGWGGDSREEALEYLRACSGDSGDDAILTALVDHGPAMIRMLEERAGVRFQPWPAGGGTTDYRPWLPGAKPGGRTLEVEGFSLGALGPWAEKHGPTGRLCSETNLLEYYRQRMHLERPGSPALRRPSRVPTSRHILAGHGAGRHAPSRLPRSRRDGARRDAGERTVFENGRVVGARATATEKRSNAGSPRPAGDGRLHPQRRVQAALDVDPLVYTCDVESNEGDGHLMGMAAGAQVAGLGDAWWMPHIPMGVHNGVVNAGGTREDRILPHTMMVNPAGRRFMNEAVNYYDAGESFGRKVGAAPATTPPGCSSTSRASTVTLSSPSRFRPASAGMAPRGGHRRALANRSGWTRNAGRRPSTGSTASPVRESTRTSTGARTRGTGRGGIRTPPQPLSGYRGKAPFYAVPVYPGASPPAAG